MRTGKVVTNSSNATIQYTYVYENNLLQKMTRGSRTFEFSYDAYGNPVSIAYRSNATSEPTYYYYALNSRGDVIALYDSTGNLYATYSYDAYGKFLVAKNASGVEITGNTSVAILNPLRYRGYVYDTETGFYYLQTRYYDPTACRFVNLDGYCATGQGITGNNMFAYCGNNPIYRYDPYGYMFSNPCSLPLVIYHYPKLNNTSELGLKLYSMGFEYETQDSILECQEALTKFDIDSPQEQAHFFAQCAAETNFGYWLTEYGDDDYFNNNGYGRKYRGAGYIQLTWDFNYYEFAKAMNDYEIYNQGADYVAENYAWHSAGWFWSNNNINAKIANGATVAEITAIVRGSSKGWEQRQDYYDRFISILH